MSIAARTGVAASVFVLSASLAMPVLAADDGLGLNLSTSIRDRMFWNLHVVSTKTKTKSEQPRDLTPEIVRIKDLESMRDRIADDLLARTNVDARLSSNPVNLSGAGATAVNVRNALQTEQDFIDYYKVKYYGASDVPGLSGIYLLDQALVSDYGFAEGEGYLTTPQGIRAKSGNPSSTVALSVGYYLNDGHNWAVEALVLGAPVRATIKGAGINDAGAPNQLAGTDIIKTKMLPPIVKFGYYFGDRSWPVRPYAGIGAMYAIFFDTKTTSNFDQYNGGTGKTSVSISNELAVGPFVGLESGDLSGWRVSLSVGRIKFSTEATLVSRGTQFRSGDPALRDYTGTVVDAIDQAEALRNTANNNANAAYKVKTGDAGATVNFMPNGFTTEMMRDLAAYKQSQGTGDGTLGTFVRKQKSTLDNTLFMLSVGRSF